MKLRKSNKNKKRDAILRSKKSGTQHVKNLKHKVRRTQGK